MNNADNIFISYINSNNIKRQYNQNNRPSDSESGFMQSSVSWAEKVIGAGNALGSALFSGQSMSQSQPHPRSCAAARVSRGVQCDVKPRGPDWN